MRQQSHLKRFAGPAVIALCFGCLLWTLRHAGRDIGALPRPDAAWLAAALGMFLIHYLMQAVGWHLILKSLGERTSSALSMRMWYSSLIARWMPGRVWYTASRLMLARQNGLRVEAVGVAIVLELAYILVGGLLITVVFAGEMLSSVAAGHGGAAAVAGVAVFIAAASAVVLRPSGLAALSRIGAVRKLMRKVAGGEVIQDSMPTMSTGRSVFLVAYYTIFWLYSGVMFGVLAHAFIPMTRAAWLACIPAFPGSWLIGFFSIITPAGLGAREGALWMMLRNAMPQSQAVVLAVSSRLMMVAAELLSVAIAFLVFKGVGVAAPQPAMADAVDETPEWHFGEFALSPYAQGILQGLARLRALHEEPETRPLRICFVASTYPRSESDTAVPWLREDLRRLKERGHDVHVFAPAFKGSESHMVDGIPVHRYRYFFAAKEDLTHDAGAPTKIRRPDYLLITLFYIVAGTVGLYRLQQREKFDLLHIHWPFPHGLFGIVAQKAHPAPLAMSFHGAELLLARKFKFVNPVLRSFTRRADLVTCNSSYTAAAIRELGTCEPIILPYGSPVPERDVTPPTSAQKTILYVGRLIERKGVEYLLQALPLVQREVNCRLVIVGNGVLLEPLKRQVREMRLERSVEFRVDIPEEELIKAYEECHVFVLPAIVDSRGDTEGLGVVLIEALSFRRPVVASAVGGIVDVIKHEQTGYLAREKDPGSLAVNLIRALTNPAEATRLAFQGYAHVQRTYNWDRIIDRTEELYHGLDRRPSHPASQGALGIDPAASGFSYDGHTAERPGRPAINATKTALTVGAGIAGVGVLALLGKHAAARLNPSTEVSVITDTVRAGTSDSGVMAEGWVVPNATVNVNVVPGAQGRIVALNANVGDYVTKGQVLAELDTTDHIDDYAAAQAAADSQRAKLSLIEHPYRPEEIEAKRLQLVSDKAAVGIAASHLAVLKQGARPQQVAQARASLTAAKAQLQLASADAARERQLFDKDLVPKSEYDQAVTAQAVAQGRVDETQASLSLLQEGARPEDIRAAQLALQQAKLTYQEDAAAYQMMLQGPRPEAVRQAAADYLASSSMAHKQALMLSHHQVVAPISGVIVARNVNVGEYATSDSTRSVSGQPLANNGRSLFVMADSSSARFSASIDQRFFHNVHVGMPVQIGLEAYPGVTFPGHITQVTPLIQPSLTKAASTSVDLSAPLTFTVRAGFNAGRFHAVPGQVGLLTLSSKEKNLVVPQSAITTYSVGQGVAYVVRNYRVYARSVQYDSSSDGDLHVTKGLKEGEEVVISDPTKLKDGMHVHIDTATADNYNTKAF